MKFLILLLISFSAFANYIPKSKVGIKSNLTVYLNKAKCEKKENESCIKIDSTYNSNYSELREFTEVEGESISCLGFCEEEIKELKCDEGFEKRKGLVSVYCYKAIQEKIVINGAKKIQYDADIAKAKMDKEERKDAIKSLKQSAVSKEWNDLSVVERKILMGLEVSDSDLGL